MQTASSWAGVMPMPGGLYPFDFKRDNILIIMPAEGLSHQLLLHCS